MTHARGVHRDVVEHRIDEAFELRFSDGLHALCGESDGEAGDCGFIEWSVDDAFGAECFLQSDRGAEHAAIHADIFAENDHGGIVFHFPRQRLGHRFDECDLGHAQLARPSSASAKRRCSATSGGNSA